MFVYSLKATACILFFFFSEPQVCLLLPPWMTHYRPQPNIYSEWDLGAAAVRITNPGAISLKMFSHHEDNQALIASDIAYHLPVVTLQKKTNSQWHEQLSTNIQQWTCALKTGGLLFKQTKGSASLITAKAPCSQMQGHPLPCFRSHAFVCMYEKVKEHENERLKGIHSFWCSLQLLASLSGQHCKISVEVINLQCANPPSGMLMYMRLHAS